jgi:hypothetical protein
MLEHKNDTLISTLYTKHWKPAAVLSKTSFQVTEENGINITNQAICPRNIST